MPILKGGAPRRRAAHSKSRHGCDTCKYVFPSLPPVRVFLAGRTKQLFLLRKRRIKCDETEPTCLRCARGGRHCIKRDDGIPSGREHAVFRTVYFSNPSKSFTVQEDSLASLEYFYTFTLPLFEASEPNILWQFLRRDAPNDQSLCHLAAALGHEHMHRAGVRLARYLEKSFCFNGRALRSMRMNAALQTSAQIAAAAFFSLLMGILQGLRGLHADMLLHLRCGSMIANHGLCNKSHIAQPELNEVIRLLEKYCISTMLFDSLGNEADKTASVLRHDTWAIKELNPGWEQNEVLIVRELDILVKELLYFMRSFRVALHDSSGRTVAVQRLAKTGYCESMPIRATLSKMAAKQAALEVALEAALEETRTGRRTISSSSILSEFALPQCLLAKIHLHCFCTKESSLENELPTFRKILNLQKTSLTQSRGRSQPLSATPFSLGLGSIACLVTVARLCPLYSMREEAIQMLRLCPATEGVWTVELATQLCSAIVAVEEQRAAAESRIRPELGLDLIPGHCRVAYYSFNPWSESEPIKARFFQGLGSMENLAYKEINFMN